MSDSQTADLCHREEETHNKDSNYTIKVKQPALEE